MRYVCTYNMYDAHHRASGELSAILSQKEKERRERRQEKDIAAVPIIFLCIYLPQDNTLIVSGVDAKNLVLLTSYH